MWVIDNINSLLIHNQIDDKYFRFTSFIYIQTRSTKNGGPYPPANWTSSNVLYEKYWLGKKSPRTSGLFIILWNDVKWSTNILQILQWKLSENKIAFDDVKFDIASLLAQLYQQQDQNILAKPILRKAIELSQHNQHWHCKLLFQLAVSMLLHCN